MSVVYTPAGDHVDVCDLSCHWGLCCGLFSMLPLEAVWIFMVFAATRHNVEVHNLSYHFLLQARKLLF